MPAKPSLVKIVLLTIIIACVATVLLKFVASYRESTARQTTKDRLHQISLALHQYHDQYNSFPPAIVQGPDGRLWHSWRTLLLPYLGEKELAAQYRFDEPWDGPHNRELAAKCPVVFQSPHWGAELGRTNYCAVIGRRTAWPAQQSIGFRDVADGASNTVHVVEGKSSATWLEPRDILARDWIKEFRAKGSMGAYVTMMDGTVRYLGNTQIDDRKMVSLLTPNSGHATFSGTDWPEEFNETIEPEGEWKSRDVRELRGTDVLAAASVPVDSTKNQIWCATSQIAWDELRNLVGGDVVTAPSPPIVSQLNAEPFDQRALSPATYIAVTTGAGPAETRALQSQVQAKFPQMAPQLEQAPGGGLGRLRLFAYLAKKMPFLEQLERFQTPLKFRVGKDLDEVVSFGRMPFAEGVLGEPVLSEQVVIGDYVSDDDFIVILNTASKERDQVILAHMPVGKTLRETWKTVESRLKTPHPNRVLAQLHTGERLEIPCMEFGISKSFQELEGLEVGTSGDLSIEYANESILFRLNEHGAEVFAVAEIGMIGEFGDEVPQAHFDPAKPRTFLFNQPFFLALREKDAPEPYFLGWIAHPEVMVRDVPTP